MELKLLVFFFIQLSFKQKTINRNTKKLIKGFNHTMSFLDLTNILQFFSYLYLINEALCLVN